MKVVQARYDSQSHAKLGLRRWRGLYGNPEGDIEHHYFRIRYMPAEHSQGYPWAIVKFDRLEDADAITEHGELRAEGG